VTTVVAERTEQAHEAAVLPCVVAGRAVGDCMPGRAPRQVAQVLVAGEQLGQRPQDGMKPNTVVPA
jgi:hypothetical protein